jgi:hypothetical protein
MAKKIPKRSFNDVLAALGTQRFDVAPAGEGANRKSGVMRVSKNGCAAEIADGQGGPVMLVLKPGWVLNGEIARLVDKGYQKFLKSTRLEIPATADKLRALHDFSNELDAITGETALYNDALGTTSDVYLYDRVAGRPDAGKH